MESKSVVYAVVALAMVGIVAVAVVLASRGKADRGIDAPDVPDNGTALGRAVSGGAVLVHPVNSEFAFDAALDTPIPIVSGGGVGITSLAAPLGYRVYSIELDEKTGRTTSKKPVPPSRAVAAQGPDFVIYDVTMENKDRTEFVMLSR
jgi:hypothetical protein